MHRAEPQCRSGEKILDDLILSPRRIDRWTRATLGALGSPVRGNLCTRSLFAGFFNAGEQRGCGHCRRESCIGCAIEPDPERSRQK
jgi:hypothetical protein